MKRVHASSQAIQLASKNAVAGTRKKNSSIQEKPQENSFRSAKHGKGKTC